MKYLPWLTFAFSALFAWNCTSQKENPVSGPTEMIENWLHLSFTEAERDSLQEGLDRNRENYKALHQFLLENEVAPAMSFNPIPSGFNWDIESVPLQFGLKVSVELPEDPEQLAFYSVADLSVLIRNRKLTSMELTNLYLNRLRKYGDSLQCVIVITEDLALEQARRADEEIAQGKYRGPLHGIPYGIKDLLNLDGFKTTWGAEPYKDQQFEGTATVVKKLEEAGAVLVAKLTLGALAMGDVWYGGVTKNPWNLEQGSSGSSAGSASATVAGLVGFSIGTETLGSIVSPSTRCGASGLRPSYGRVSRTGAMALSWSMDKIGPICRTIQDCAIVFAAINGPDQIDPTLFEVPFNFDASKDVKSLKVGYIKSYFDDNRNKENDDKTLEVIRSLGIEPVEVSLPDDLPVSALRIILAAEAGAAFDSLTRGNLDDLLVRQDKGAWPNYFRTSRFIPAAEYINANRVRTLLIQKMHEILKAYDVVITPSFGGNQLLITNLTGQPCVVVPNGFNEEGSPTSISFIGSLFREGPLLELAHAYQQATDWEDKHPPLW